ncbi:MAG: DUF559 domain-containing protein [Solirubrobacterales bacterium]
MSGQLVAAVAGLAAAQCGVISRAQLLGLGATPRIVASWIAAGRLHPLHRGIYLVGHRAEHPRAREMAAVLACGEHAFVAGRSAGWLWRILEARPAVIEVILAHGDRRRAGILIRRSTLTRRDKRHLGPVPLTSPARTLLDLAATLEPASLERALSEATSRHLTTRPLIVATLKDHPNALGTRPLRALFELERGPALTRSEAEGKLLTLIRRADLPSPQTNARLGDYEVDFLWHEQRVIVEVDGFAFHGSRAAFERDRRRDAVLQSQGLKVIRITWRQLVGEPELVIARLAAILAVASF